MERIITLDGITAIADRVNALPWQTILHDLNTQGYAVTSPLLNAEECRYLISLYGDRSLFRSHVIMQRHAFGHGEYQYFDYPLPNLINELRLSVYPHLASLANQWSTELGKADVFPETLPDFLNQCHQAGQLRPTPLILKYEPGDFNRLHQDLYGELMFPLQLTIQLSQPDRDFSGGEFVLVEQRPRMQSQAEVVSLRQGEAVIFAVSHRPVRGDRGFYRVNLRHGVSRVRSGQRYTLGVIFHDAV